MEALDCEGMFWEEISDMWMKFGKTLTVFAVPLAEL
jgi:hypothetical protein